MDLHSGRIERGSARRARERSLAKYAIDEFRPCDSQFSKTERCAGGSGVVTPARRNPSRRASFRIDSFRAALTSRRFLRREVSRAPCLECYCQKTADHLHLPKSMRWSRNLFGLAQ